MKHFGKQKVLFNAGDWTVRAFMLLEQFAIISRNEEFTMDDFKEYAKVYGLEEPHHPNAWGALTSAASKGKLIKFTGKMVPSKRHVAKDHMIRVWTRN